MPRPAHPLVLQRLVLPLQVGVAACQVDVHRLELHGQFYMKDARVIIFFGFSHRKLAVRAVEAP